MALRRRLISSTIAALASGSRQRTGSSSTDAKSARGQVLALGRPHRGDLGDVAVDADPERGEQAAGERAGGDARGGLAGAGPLEHVADVVVAVLLGADQVGVPGTRQVDLVDLRVDRPGVHPLLPVGVVAVGDQDRDRAAQGATVAHAGADLDRVGLDLHPPAAAVAELAPRHVAVERLAVELEAGRHALDDRDQPRAVRLACGGETEARAHGRTRLSARRASHRVERRLAASPDFQRERSLADQDLDPVDDLRAGVARRAQQSGSARRRRPCRPRSAPRRSRRGRAAARRTGPRRAARPRSS